MESRVGGDSGLTERGRLFAKSLEPFFEEEFKGKNSEVSLLTSTLKRTITTAEHIKLPKLTRIHLKVLDEINAGVCETLTYAEIAKHYPDIPAQRLKDKLRFRYPRGESYLDLISRLESVIQWIERQKHPIIVVAHQAVLRCIYAYFFKLDKLEIPYIKIPFDTVIKLIPETYFFNEVLYQIDPTTHLVGMVIEKRSKKSLENFEEKEGEKKKKIKKV